MIKILFILIILLLTGCSMEDKDKNKEIEKLINDPPVEPQEPQYVDTNPLKGGLYKKGKLVKEYNTNFQDRKDIAVFDIVYSNLDDLGSTNLKNNWYKYYNEYTDIKDYKTGFYLSFETSEKKYESLIKDPSKQHDLHPYLYYYLYDGVHATGHYSHLEMKDLKEDTIYASIKLYMHLQSKDIISPITLTVFTYKDDNDFIDGHYRGNSYHTITIENK